MAANAHRLAQTHTHVVEPGPKHCFIQGMDLTLPEAAAQQRLFGDVAALIHKRTQRQPDSGG